MKRTFLLLLLLPLITSAQVNLKKDLVAYYPFNGNANDESGNKNNPSVVKATFIPDRFGKSNAACYFNGKNNYIRIPDNPSLHFRKGFSISAWVLVKDFYEGTCHGNRIIMKGSSDSYSNSGNYVLTFDDSKFTNGGNCYSDKPDKKHQSFYGAQATPITNDYVVPNKWYMLTYTYDGNTASLYVDCKLQSSGKINNYNFSNNEDLFFGKMDNIQYPYWFNGFLDEVRIYNRALSKNEILLLCDNKLPAQSSEINCNELTKVPAKFTYTISNCTTITCKLSTSDTKDIKNIQWSFGDGTSSNKLSPIHNYKKTGVYKIKAIVTSKYNCIDTFMKEIKLQELSTDFVYAEQGEPGNIQFKAKNNNAAYAWAFGDGNTANSEAVTTNLYNKSGQYMVQLLAENSIGCKDTVKKRVEISLPVSIVEEPIIPNTTINSIPAYTAPEIKLEKREKDFVKNIDVENDSISISLYDNGIIDGDSITLVYNNEIILAHQLLSSKPLTLYLKVDPNRSSNELLMYAENLGSIPPNTALMIIKDGNKRHEVNVSSNKTTNGVISFTIKR